MGNNSSSSSARRQTMQDAQQQPANYPSQPSANLSVQPQQQQRSNSQQITYQSQQQPIQQQQQPMQPPQQQMQYQARPQYQSQGGVPGMQMQVQPQPQQMQMQVPPPMPVNQAQQNDMFVQQQQMMQQQQRARRPTTVKEFNDSYKQMGKGADGELKNFYMKAYLQKDSIKVNLTEEHMLQLSFKVDCSTRCFVRVNTCVTEKRNPDNVPEMFYTPNRQNYVQQISLTNSGLGQEVEFEKCQFDMNYLAAFELSKSIKDYHPLIISLNYNDNSKQYAMMSYAVFVKDANQNITGARVTRQVCIVNGIPFEIKTIFGLEEHVEEGAEHVEGAEEDEDKECLICLSEPKDTLLMPCSHMCVCEDCGKQLVKGKHTCPVCRGNISALIPMKKHIH